MYLSVSDVQTFDPMSDLQLRLFIFLCFFNYAVWTALLFGCAAPTDLPRDRLTLSLSLSFFLLIFSDKPTNKPGKRKRKKEKKLLNRYTRLYIINGLEYLG